MKLMDSINKNQSEENKADLTQEEALVKIKELIKQTDTCFFSTKAGIGRVKGKALFSGVKAFGFSLPQSKCSDCGRSGKDQSTLESFS